MEQTHEEARVPFSDETLGTLKFGARVKGSSHGMGVPMNSAIASASARVECSNLAQNTCRDCSSVVLCTTWSIFEAAHRSDDATILARNTYDFSGGEICSMVHSFRCTTPTAVETTCCMSRKEVYKFPLLGRVLVQICS
jgi:hypothetical protein